MDKDDEDDKEDDEDEEDNERRKKEEKKCDFLLHALRVACTFHYFTGAIIV